MELLFIEYLVDTISIYRHNMVRWQFDWAPQAAKLLNGVFCVYKPEGLSTGRVIHLIKENLAKGKCNYDKKV